jgi:hypothetical protein
MKARMVWVFGVSLIVVFCLAGCGRRVVTGQVFIVSRDGNNKKLGLVDVALIEQREIERSIAKKENAIAQQTILLESNIRKSKPKLEKAEKERATFDADNQDYFRFKEQVDELEQKRKKLDSDLWFRERESVISSPERKKEEIDELKGKLRPVEAELKALRQAIGPREEKHEKLLEDVVNARAELDSAEADLRGLREFMFSNFDPVILTKATSDADGKFSMTCPRHGKFAVFARTSEYVWLFWLPATASEPLLLSNNNVSSSVLASSIMQPKATAP